MGRTSRTYGVAPWSKRSPIWWDRISACFFAGSIPERARVTSAFVRPPGEPVLEIALCRWIHRVRFLTH